MKALRFLTILLTTFSLYTVQTMVTQPAFASSDEEQGFFSGGAGANVSVSGEEKSADEKKGMNLNMIVLLSAVLTAPMFALSCNDRIDTWIYMATAVVYVGMEIANWNTYKAQSKREMRAKRSAEEEKNEEQKRSLEKASRTTKAAADAAGRRAKAANIAKMGFMAAGAIALVMSIWHAVPACITAGGECDMYMCKNGLASNDSLEDMYLGPDEEFNAIANVDYNRVEQYMENAGNDQDFLIRNVELDRVKKGAVTSIDIESASILQETFPETKKENMFVTAFKAIGYNIADLLLPKAEANGAKIAALGIGAVGAALIGTKVIALSPTLKTVTKNGFVRAAFHLVMGGMAGKVAGDAQEAANMLNGRAAQYDELAMKLDINAETNINHVTDINTDIDVGATGLTAIDKGNVEGRTCFTGSKGQLNEDKNCACKDAKNCKRSEIPKISSMSQIAIPSAITTSTEALGVAGNALFNGELGGALSQSNAAGKNAARLRKLNIGLQKKANEGFIAHGKKAIDFDRLLASSRRKLIKAAMSDIKNLNSNGKAVLAERFPGVFGDGSDVEKNPNTDIKIGDTNVKTGASVAAKGSAGSKKKDPMAGFAFDIEDSEDVKEAEATNPVATLGAGDDQVELDKEDIAGDRNKNIFSLITKRYFKTAYPRFFETRE